MSNALSRLDYSYYAVDKQGDAVFSAVGGSNKTYPPYFGIARIEGVRGFNLALNP
ncbi:MAG: hypothetical protein AB1589_41105 [Cyanobacteriota bacterium]